MPESPADTSRIPTNLRCLLILEVLGKSDRAMTPTEINAHIGLPKPTVHRLCHTLEKEGFIARSGRSFRYHASRRLRELGGNLLGHSRLHIVRHQILMELSRTVGETVNFVIPEPSGMNYIDRFETDWAIRVQLPIGSRVPFHCTASGKTFLASMAPQKRKLFIGSLDLSPETMHTHVSPDSLLAEIKTIAKDGYAMDREELILGMIAISVPVNNRSGGYMGAVSFHAPKQRMSVEDAIRHLPHLRSASHKLSKALFEDDSDKA